jgi:ubiquinone/menaquinone biosynthesis C-methylase UbiE
MSTLAFDEDMGRIQRALAPCHDMVRRRSVVLEALNLRTGEHVLEIGCGGGFYAYEAAQCVGPTGRVCAIDISADQLAAAREHCAGVAWVECQQANATALPYGEGEFDAVYAVQVLEVRGHPRRGAAGNPTGLTRWRTAGHLRHELEFSGVAFDPA